MGEPARGYSWPPFQPGNTAAVKDGVFAERYLRPIVDELLAGLEDAAPWTTRATFAAARTSWAYAEAQAALYRDRFDRLGLFDDDGEPRPGLERWDRAESRAANLRAQLGLDPMSMAKLLGSLSAIDAVAAEEGLESLVATGRAVRLAHEQRALTAAQDGDGEDAA